MNILVENSFGHGAIKTHPFIKVVRPKLGGSLPFDWNVGYDVEVELGKILNNPTFTIPTKDQGWASSCGGEMMSYYIASIEAARNKIFSEKSAKYVYAPIHAPGGGSAYYDLVNRVTTKGVCREALVPTIIHHDASDEAFMTDTSWQSPLIDLDASTSHATYSQGVNYSIDEMAAAIRDHFGIGIGLTGQNNGTWLSDFPKPPVDNSNTWNHWIYAGKAKLINGVKYIGVKNSGGDTVGTHGWQWLSEDYITSGYLWDVFALTDDRPQSAVRLAVYRTLLAFLRLLKGS